MADFNVEMQKHTREEDDDSGIPPKIHRSDEKTKCRQEEGDGGMWLERDCRPTPSISYVLSSCMRYRTEVPPSPIPQLPKATSFQSSKDFDKRYTCNTSASPNDSGYVSLGIQNPHSVTSLGYGSFAGDRLSPVPIKRGNHSLEKTYSASTNIEVCKIKDFRTLQKNYISIKKEILPKSGLADELLQIGIIDQNKYDEIRSSKRAERGADILIKALAYNLTSSRMEAFIRALYKCNHGHVADMLEKEANKEELESCRDSSTHQKFAPLRTKLGKIRTLLIQDFEPKCIIDQLLEKGVIRFIDHEDIYTMPRNVDRIHTTLDCVKKKLEKNLGPFCHILQQHSERLAEEIEKLLEDTESLGESDTGDPLQLQLTLRNGMWDFQQKGSFEKCPKMTMHINFNTDEEHGVDNEVVKRHKNTPNHSLDIKLMEFHMQSGGIDKGSVVIRLKPLTWRALKKLKSAKPDDLAAIIKSLLTKGDVEKLQESGLKSVDIKIIADTNLSTPKEARQDEGIRKEAIVKHFTDLSKSLPNLWELIPAFLQDDKIRDSAKTLLKLLMHLKRDARNETFLRFLLEEESDRVRVIFKRQLKQRRMINILKILESPGDGDKEIEGDLGTDEIKKNYSFLLEELDGLEFLPAFTEKGLLGDEVLEKMIGSVHRRERTKLFIDFVLSSGDETRDLFYKDLHKRQQEYIYNVLWSTKYPSPGSSETRASLMLLKKGICDNFTMLIEEIEPREYRDVFVEREIFEAKEYDDLINISPRKLRAAAFLNRLLLIDTVLALKTFVWILCRTGNEHLAHRLEVGEETDEEMENLDHEEETNAHEKTILTAVFDASIVSGNTRDSNAPTGDVGIYIDYPFSAIRDALQFSDLESIPLQIPDGTVDESLSKRNVIAMLMDCKATETKIYTSIDETQNQTPSSSSTETPSADSGHLLKRTISLKAQLPFFAPARITLDGETPVYSPEFRESRKVSHFKEISLPRSKSSEVLKSNQRKCIGRTSYLNAPIGDAVINVDYPFSDIHDPLQLWDSESVPHCIPDGIVDESMSSDEKVIDWLWSTLKDETHNQASSSLSTPYAESGSPLKSKMSLKAQLPLFASAGVALNGDTPVYVSEFRESKKVSHLKDMSHPRSESSEVLKSNQRKCLGKKLRRRSIESSCSHQRSSSATTVADKCWSPASSATQIFDSSLIDQYGSNDVNDPFICSDITCKNRVSLELNQEDSFSDISSNGSPRKFGRRTMCCEAFGCYRRTVGKNGMSPRIILKPQTVFPVNY